MNEVVEVSYGPNGEMFLHLRKVAPMPYHKDDRVSYTNEGQHAPGVVIIDLNKDDLEEFNSNSSTIVYEM